MEYESFTFFFLLTPIKNFAQEDNKIVSGIHWSDNNGDVVSAHGTLSVVGEHWYWVEKSGKIREFRRLHFYR